MKKKKNKYLKIVILVIIFLILSAFFTYVIFTSSNKEILKEFNKEGYDSENKDIFYKKIVTNNTLDDYYKDLSNDKDSQYLEYYFSKDSTDFIELKMIYKNGVNTTLNIVSNLKINETTYNYELSYKTAHLLLEGNSTNNYECRIIKNNKISRETANSYCEMIIDEIDNFNKEKEELLKNDKIKSLIEKNKP